MKANHRRIYNFAYRMTGSAADAEDITQQAFIRAFRAFGSFEGHRPFLNWMLRIVTRLYLDHVRTRNRRVQTVSLNSPLAKDDGTEDLFYDQADSTYNPEQVLLSHILREDLETSLMRLSAKDRAIILLRDVQELSSASISEVLGVPVGTVRSRIHRARAALRRALIEERSRGQRCLGC